MASPRSQASEMIVISKDFSLKPVLQQILQRRHIRVQESTSVASDAETVNRARASTYSFTSLDDTLTNIHTNTVTHTRTHTWRK